MLDAWDRYRRDYIGRPSPLYFAERLTEFFGGAKIYLKRDELNHTGAHKINNVIGQILLAKRMGKNKIIAENGAGPHGVATVPYNHLHLPKTPYQHISSHFFKLHEVQLRNFTSFHYLPTKNVHLPQIQVCHCYP